MANAGRVAIVPKGDYSSSTAYNRLDLVRYNEKAYVAKKANTGILPTNTEYWMLMTSDGITIDTALSDTSTNPVQNKVVKTALDNIQTTSQEALAQVTAKGEYLNTSILEKAVEVVSGVHNFKLGGGDYTGNDLPNGNYAYGMATIYKRSTSFIAVVLWGRTNYNPQFNTYASGAWSGWDEFATTADLANKLNRNGGIVDTIMYVGTVGADSSETICFQNNKRKVLNQITSAGLYVVYDSTNSKRIYSSESDGTNTFNGTATGNLPLTGGILNGELRFKVVENGYGKVVKNHSASADEGMTLVDYDKDGNFARLLVSAKYNKAQFVDNSGSKKDIHHDGNSAKVVVSETAPTDTSALWVDKTNKKTKAYIDGAWTVIA